MLIKLGGVWVDPQKVQAISYDRQEGMVCITTDRGCHINPGNDDIADSYAGLVNQVLNQQSYPHEAYEA